MADSALSPERRRELVELLDDEQRLKTEHPKVADYLDSSPQLPGTGNAKADAAFDLRFVHYLTGGTTVSPNPYWDIVAPSVSSRDGRQFVDGGNPDGSVRLGYAQTILQETYAYAIPSPDTIEWIGQFADGRRIVELGAGRGYWLAQLANAGFSVAGYESEPPDTTDNPSFPRGIGPVDIWHPVGDLGGYDARLDAESDVLFLCWPPGWGNAMASEALTTFEERGGQRLIFVGQPQGGMTGDDAFFDALTARWKVESEDTGFVSWWNLGDVAQAWTRP